MLPLRLVLSYSRNTNTTLLSNNNVQRETVLKGRTSMRVLGRDGDDALPSPLADLGEGAMSPNVRQNLFYSAKKQSLGEIGQLLRLCKIQKNVHPRTLTRGTLHVDPAGGSAQTQLKVLSPRSPCGLTISGIHAVFSDNVK